MVDQILIILVVAAVVVPLFRRLRLSSVLGYLLAGAVIGPFGFGLIDDNHGARELAEIGVIFLLFSIGLELSFERLMTMRRYIFGLGAAQVTSGGAVIGLAAFFLGLPPETAAVIGLALALSSTAIVLQVLSEQGELVARAGRVSFSVLLFQDIAVAPILVFVSLAGIESDTILLELGWVAIKAVAAVAVILIAGRFVLHGLFRWAAQTRDREMFTALAMLAALATGFTTHAAGLSAELGAFLAGLVLATGKTYRHQVEADIEPFKGILLGFFFMTVGMSVDPALLSDQGATVLAIVLGLLAIKAALLFGLGLVFGLGLGLSVRVALTLAESGEFAFVILALAVGNGLIGDDVSQILVMAVAISMMLTPLLAAAGRGVQTRLEGRRRDGPDTGDPDAQDLRDHVILAGFGRVGQTVGHLLEQKEIPYIAIDADPGRVEAARGQNHAVIFGNVGQAEILDQAGADRARAIVVTVNEPKLAERIVGSLRVRFPHVPILARAHDHTHSTLLRDRGAHLVVPEAVEASLQLGREVLKLSGTAAEDIDQILTGIRDRDYEALARIIPAGGER